MKHFMKWEYKAVTITSDNEFVLSGLLNDYGCKGWRIIHCDLINNYFIFERSVEPETSEETKRMMGYFGGKVG